MSRKEGHNLETLVERYALPGIAAVILYRAFHVRLPGVEDLFITPEEQVSDALGDLNLQETEAGRAPFVLTRSVTPYQKKLESSMSFYNDDDDYFDGYLADDYSGLGELGTYPQPRRRAAPRPAPKPRPRPAPRRQPAPQKPAVRRALQLPSGVRLPGAIQQIASPGDFSITSLNPSTYAVTGIGEPPPSAMRLVSVQRRQPGHSTRDGVFDSINTTVSSLFGKRSNSTPQDGAPQSNEPSANDGGSFGGLGTIELVVIAGVALFALKGKS
jgi:hypothetical protein